MANKVKPVPDGYHTVTPHLIQQDAAAAIEFYKKAFGAEERSRMAAPGGKIVHAEIRIGSSIVMLADENPMNPTAKAPGSTGGFYTAGLMLYVEDVDSFFQRAVKAGAKVEMPVADMFWGDRYGTLSDPWGHRWSVGTHIKDMTPEEMEKAAQAAMAQMPKP